MINRELLDILVCPEDHSRLELADDRLVARLNRAIEAGTLVNRGGQKVRSLLDGGLIREDGLILYPIVDEIPVMLLDKAIVLDEWGGVNDE